MSITDLTNPRLCMESSEPVRISRFEFERISFGGKQYACGKPISIESLKEAPQSLIVWYHDRPYALPPLKHKPDGILQRPIKIERDLTGNALTGFVTKTEKVFVKANLQYIYEAVDITGTVKVETDFLALNRMILEEPTMTCKGTYVHRLHELEEDQETDKHCRPYVTYTIGGMQVGVTYRSGIYRIDKLRENDFDPFNPFECRFFWSPSPHSVLAFIQQCNDSGLSGQEIIDNLPNINTGRNSRVGLKPKNYPFRKPGQWGTARGLWIDHTSLCENHLWNIHKWMFDRIFDKLPVEILNPAHRPNFEISQNNAMYRIEYTFAALAYELYIRVVNTQPVKNNFSDNEIFEPGRTPLRDGGDVNYIMINQARSRAAGFIK